MGAGGVALWLEFVISDAGDQAFSNSPLYGFACPCAWLVNVAAQIGTGAHVNARVVGIVHEHGGELFAGDSGIWLKGVAKAGNDTLAGSPVQGLYNDDVEITYSYQPSHLGLLAS